MCQKLTGKSSQYLCKFLLDMPLVDLAAGRRLNTALFDINTWVILARNVTNSTLAEKEWNISKLQDMGEDLDRWEHDIIRVRLIRNKLFHMNAPEMDDIEFTVNLFICLFKFIYLVL